MDVINTESNHSGVTPKLGEYTYNSLGIWRKLYLGLNWFFSVVMVFGVSYVAITEGTHYIGLGIMLLAALLFFGSAYWLHHATVQRKTAQLLAIAILNIVPFLNPIAAILVFAIRSTSKSERSV